MILLFWFIKTLKMYVLRPYLNLVWEFSMVLSVLIYFLNAELEQIRTAGREKHIYTIASAQAPRLRVEGHEHELINCCANNYLGFAVPYQLNNQYSYTCWTVMPNMYIQYATISLESPGGSGERPPPQLPENLKRTGNSQRFSQQWASNSVKNVNFC